MSDNKALKSKLGYVGSVPGKDSERDSNAWYTPAKYIESARKVLGEIDLDPFSSLEANQVVKAKNYYTQEDNALNKSWNPKEGKGVKHRVWMNPPYSGKLCSQSVAKFLEE